MNDVIAARIIIEERGVPASGAAPGKQHEQGTALNNLLGDIRRMMHKDSTLGLGGAGGLAGLATKGGWIAAVVAAVLGVMGWASIASFRNGARGDNTPSEDPFNTNYQQSDSQKAAGDAAAESFKAVIEAFRTPQEVIDFSMNTLDRLMSDQIDDQKQVAEILAVQAALENSRLKVNNQIAYQLEQGKSATSEQEDMLMRIQVTMELIKELTNSTVVAINDQNKAIRQQVTLLTDELNLAVQIQKARSNKQSKSSDMIKAEVGGNEYEGRITVDRAINHGAPVYIGVRSVN